MASIVDYRFRAREEWLLIRLEEETKSAGAYFDNFASKDFKPRDAIQVVFLNPGMRIPRVPQFSNTEEVFDLQQGEFPGTFQSGRD